MFLGCLNTGLKSKENNQQKINTLKFDLKAPASGW